jgi:hypothetical protein
MNASGPETEGMLMPIHDWTRVDAGIFHHFHQRWIGVITDVLNQRLLPKVGSKGFRRLCPQGRGVPEPLPARP